MFGSAYPPPKAWVGLVAANDRVVFGIGALYAGMDGRWWITFQRWPGAGRVKTAHKAAKQLLAVAQEAGLELHAFADPGIDGAEKWLVRLGFQKTDETLGGVPIWVLR